MHSRLVLLTLGVGALLALPSTAHGIGPFVTPYNDSGYNYTTGTDASATVGNSGLYVRDPVTLKHIRSLSGPHGGYTATTNKCRDCHAVHAASAGGILLLRATSQADACAFCHTGGGGSSTNIQMDNDYDAFGAIIGSPGSGTGHTLGYAGNAPVDIKPAYSNPSGLMCFNCHTPHGSSARVLTTFANPGRPMGDAFVATVWSGSTLVATAPDDLGIDLAAFNGGAGTFWGPTVLEGNIATVENGAVEQHPVWPTGRFLLVKDPHPTWVELADDSVAGQNAGSAGREGYNKVRIDWTEPLGPADSTYGGSQDADNDTDYFGSEGLLSVSEFCTDCHDGSAGAVSQLAVVWQRSESDPTTGTYVSVYSHDSQPRDLCRQQFLAPAGTADDPDGTDDNFGPSCRQCHTGGSSCRQCHGTDDLGVSNAAHVGSPTPADGRTSYWPQASISRSAVASLSGQCIDAGFSWPHRTLAVNLLPDELWGVNFDGTPVAPGQYRSDPSTLVAGFLAGQPDASEPATTAWKPFVDAEARIATAAAENLDSVCLTCHGDGSYYRGDDPAYFTTTPYGSGWELLLKGLP